jgi:hypothetical protein
LIFNVSYIALDTTHNVKSVIGCVEILTKLFTERDDPPLILNWLQRLLVTILLISTGLLGSTTQKIPAFVFYHSSVFSATSSRVGVGKGAIREPTYPLFRNSPGVTISGFWSPEQKTGKIFLASKILSGDIPIETLWWRHWSMCVCFYESLLVVFPSFLLRKYLKLACIQL